MKRIVSIALLLLVFAGVGLAQQHLRVLFLGNSYTAYNNLPTMTSSLALSLGDTLTTDSNIPGGYRLSDHWGNPTSTGKISNGNWDYMILQEQSQVPALGGSFYQDFLTGATNLDSLLKATDSCATTLFYMTWGRKNGDASNCQFIPDICTYEGMQLLLRSSYLQAGGLLNAPTAPVGMVWRQIRNQYPAIELYNPDESHPSVAGSYAAACTFYASMFHKSPAGATYTAGLDSLTAAQIQGAAATIVFDSLDTWRIDTVVAKASFTFTTDSIGTITLINASSGNVISWDLGNGNLAMMDTVEYTYTPVDSVYNITLIVEKGCVFDTMIQAVRVYYTQEPTGLYADPVISCKVYPNPATNQLLVSATELFYIKMFDSQGCLILDGSGSWQDQYQLNNVAFLPRGLYYLQIITRSGKILSQKVRLL